MLPFRRYILQSSKDARTRPLQSLLNATGKFGNQPSRSCATWAKTRPTTTPELIHYEGPDTLRAWRMYSSGSLQVYPEKGDRHTAFLAFGSNLGDRISNIEQGLDAMRSHGLDIVKISNLYETKAMYYENQEDFMNGVCMIETTKGPLELLDTVQAIEQSLGRVRTIDKGPRTLDLDILLYDLIELDRDRLKIPHESMHERWFVLKPFFDICPLDYFPVRHPYVAKFLNGFKKLRRVETTSEPLAICALASDASFIRASDPTRETRVMAIINLTPDSFSDGGVHDFDNVADVGRSIRRYVQEGASIIDLGGQSTRPNATLLSATQELARILPHIKEMKSSPDLEGVLLSVDTFYADVALEAARAGADIINDVSAGLLDDQMLPTAAKLHKTVILMHMRGNPQTMTKLTAYPGGLIHDVATELRQRIDAAFAAGIPPWKIILDPGLGFAKTKDQNLELLQNLRQLQQHPAVKGFPWLVGASRKGFIGNITGVRNANERGWGTAAAITAAIAGGADIVRVHDVKEMAQVTKMADAIYRHPKTNPR